MRLQESVLDDVMRRLVQNEITERHRREERKRFEMIYGITSDNVEDNLQKLFDISIQNRSGEPKGESYEEISDRFSPGKFLEFNSWRKAFEYLIGMKNIKQKIVNDYLRKVVYVLLLRDGWIDELDVPLDTHVIKSLIKTGAIELEGKKYNGKTNRVVNTKPGSNPRKRIGYDKIQRSFKESAEKFDQPRIVFDELWLEHKFYISDPLLREKSCLFDLLKK